MLKMINDKERIKVLKKENEKLKLQLSKCYMTALFCHSALPKLTYNDDEWSLAYENVLKLRKDYDNLVENFNSYIEKLSKEYNVDIFAKIKQQSNK
jgi:hypothetical protein